MTTFRMTVAALLVAFVMGPFTAVAQEMGEMEMGEGYVPDSLSRTKLAPLVKGYYDDGEAFFIHTEASDEKIAAMLTKMMGPKVAHVSALTEAPEGIRSPLYVFVNGVKGKGPMGYQPDVLARVPGDEKYSPFVEIHRVRWAEEATPRELRSKSAIQKAETNGKLVIKSTGIVVNAPVLAWPEGRR